MEGHTHSLPRPAPYTAQGQLTPIPPFDFGRSLGFLALYNPAAAERSLAGSALTKAVFVEGRVVAFQVRAIGTVEESRLAYTLYAETALTEGLIQAAELSPI